MRPGKIPQHDLSRLSNEELEILERLLEKATPQQSPPPPKS
jgi:hypothetical protein